MRTIASRVFAAALLPILALPGISLSQPSAQALSVESTKKQGSPPSAITPGPARKFYTETLAKFLLHHNRKEAEQGFQQVTRLDPSYAPAW
jgi:hypothetical protein